jgi:tetratricopeptide (TPR) repeat protein
MKDILLKPPEKVPFDLYGQGWAMTHFVTFSKERSPQMRQYLAALNAGKSPTEAAAAFGDLDRLNREAHLYVSQGSFAYTPVQVPVHEPVIEQVSDVGAAEAALIPETIAFADYDLSEVRKDEDRERARRQRAELLKRIETKTAQFPNDPAALMLLAQAERTAGNSRAAEEAANRLLALQPSNIDALVLKSRLLSAEAETLAGSERANMVAQARHLAVEANKINQDNPLGYVAYFESMKASGEPVPPDALDALAAAVEKLPANTGIRQELVDELAAEKRYALAIQALLPLASDTHDSPLRTAARERLTKLQAMAAASR